MCSLHKERIMGIICLLVLLLSTAMVASADITWYKVPTTQVYGPITAGPDGALWFTAQAPDGVHDAIGQMTTSGVVTLFPLTTTNNWSSAHITRGPDGALWFTQSYSDREPVGAIGRITTDGTITEYPVPSGEPIHITAGPDGALWYTTNTNLIGHITTAGAIKEYTVPDGMSCAGELTTGPDGALWCAGGWQILRITTDGLFTGYFLYDPKVAETMAYSGIVTGPDGALWFVTETKVARITTAGQLTVFDQLADDITTATGGALSFAGETIGRITSSGTVTAYGRGFRADELVAGSDGALWFTDSAGYDDHPNWIGRLFPSPENAKPVSRVYPIPAMQRYQPWFGLYVRWSGTGFNIQDFTVYVSDNDGPFVPWLTETPYTEGWFTGTWGHTYKFYSIARNSNGSQEDPKMTAEAIGITPPRGDINADGRVDCTDIAIVRWNFGGHDSYLDVNRDGIVDFRDMVWVAQNLPSGTRCSP